MIIRKFLGLYETLHYSAITYRLMQTFVIIKLLILLPVFMVCTFLWPLYFGYRLWKHYAHGAPFAPAVSAYLPFGVRGGIALNLICFLGLYIGVPILAYVNRNNTNGPEFAQSYQNLRQPEPASSPRNETPYFPSDFGIKYEKSLLEGDNSNQADLYVDNADSYEDDPEDEISYPPEIYDASAD